MRSPSSSRRARKRPRDRRGPTVLVRLARTVEVVDGPREAVELYREALAEAQGDEALEAEIQLRLAGAVAETDDRRSGLAHAELAVESRVACGGRCASVPGPVDVRAPPVPRTGQGIPREQMEQALALEQSLGAWQVDRRSEFVLRLPARLGG